MVTYAVLFIYCCLKFYLKPSTLNNNSICYIGLSVGQELRLAYLDGSGSEYPMTVYDILGHKSLGCKKVWLLPGCLLDYSLWGKVAMSWGGTPHQTVRRYTWQETKACCQQQTPIYNSFEWGILVRIRFPSPRQVLRGLPTWLTDFDNYCMRNSKPSIMQKKKQPKKRR